MKRTLERIGFMLIGAILVSIAYLLGNADRDANAQEKTEFESVTIKGSLTVHGPMFVGNSAKDPYNSVLIFADDNGAAIFISNDYSKGDKTASQVIITANTNNKGIPIATMVLKDNDGNFRQADSKLGWR